MNIEIESELINYYRFYINVLVIQNLTSKLSTVVNPLQGYKVDDGLNTTPSPPRARSFTISDAGLNRVN